MAEQPQVITTQTVQGYLIQPTNDGKQIALVFRVQSGLSGYAFSHADFAVFAAKVLETVAAEELPASEPANGMRNALFPVEAISFETDPERPSAVTVASQLGRLRLAWSLDINTFLQAVKQFLDRRRASRTGSD